VDTETDRVLGLNLFADDYLIKTVWPARISGPLPLPCLSRRSKHSAEKFPLGGTCSTHTL